MSLNVLRNGVNRGTALSSQYSNNKSVASYSSQSTNSLDNLKGIEPSNKNDLTELWLRRIDKTLEWRRSLKNGDGNWEKAINLYKGNHWRDKVVEGTASDDANDLITVQLVMSSVLNMAPFLLFKNPEFQCKARKPEDNVKALLQQGMVNYEFIHNDMIVEIKKSLYDQLIVGHGIIKTGYTIEIDEAATKKYGELNYDQFIKKDSPFIKRICPFLFLFDPTAPQHNLSAARWVCEIFFQTIGEIVNNTRYDSSVRNKIKSGVYQVGTKSTKFPNGLDNLTSDLSTINSQMLSSTVGNSIEENPEETLGVLYEVWDKRSQQYFVFADGVMEPLIQKPWPYDYLENEFPYVKGDYIPVNDEPYGFGMPFTIQDQQWELNRVRTREFQHGRRFNRKYEVLTSVNPSEVEKLKTGMDGTIIRVEALESVRPIPEANMSQDNQIIEAMIKGDVQEITGADALLRGGQLPSRTTAGEINTRTTLFRLKLDDRVDDTDRWVLRIGRQILKHIKANVVREKVVRILGKQGEYWVKVSPLDIQAEVDVEMETIAAPKVDPIMDRQQRLQLFEMTTRLMPLIAQGMIKIDVNELFKWVLEAFQYQDVGRFFQSALLPIAPLEQPSPIQGQGNVVPFPQQQQQQVSGLPQPGQPAQTVEDLQRSFQGAGAQTL